MVCFTHPYPLLIVTSSTMTSRDSASHFFVYPNAPTRPAPGRPLRASRTFLYPDGGSLKRPRVHDGVPLLNCPTLQCSHDMMQGIRLIAHSDATLQQELTGLDYQYLRTFFDTDARREHDTARRLDAAACQRVLQEYKNLDSITTAVSCLTAGQHRHYRSIVEASLNNPRRPPGNTATHPDTVLILDLVHREQAAYHDLLKRCTTTCTMCAAKQGGHTDSSIPHPCTNANFLEEAHIVPYAKHKRRVRMQQRVVDFLALSRRGGEQIVPAGELSTVIVHTVHSFQRAYDEAAAVVLTSLASVVEFTPQSKLTTATPAAVTPLPYGLDLSCLPIDDDTKDNHGTDEPAVETAERNWSAVMDSNHALLHRPPPQHPEAPLPQGSLRISGFILSIHMESLLAITTAHLPEGMTGGKNGFRLPVRVRADTDPGEDAYKLHMELGPPAPREIVRRRDIVSDALTALIDRLPEVQSRGPLTRFAADVSLQASESGAPPLNFRVVGECTADLSVAGTDGPSPHFRLVKVNYLPQVVGEPPLLESFEAVEVLRLGLIFRCLPTATVSVHYVDATTATLIAVHNYHRASWAAYTVAHPSLVRDADVQHAWSWLADALRAFCRKLVSTVAVQLGVIPAELRNGPEPIRLHYFLIKVNDAVATTKKLAASRDPGRLHKCELRLYVVTSVYPDYSLRYAVEDEAKMGKFIEPRSEAVAVRDYLPPLQWPYTDRTPFTFPPRQIQAPSGGA